MRVGMQGCMCVCVRPRHASPEHECMPWTARCWDGLPSKYDRLADRTGRILVQESPPQFHSSKCPLSSSGGAAARHAFDQAYWGRVRIVWSLSVTGESPNP